MVFSNIVQITNLHCIMPQKLHVKSSNAQYNTVLPNSGIRNGIADLQAMNRKITDINFDILCQF